MYSIDYDKFFKLLSWEVIFWGIKNEIIGADSAIAYANTLIKNNVNENEALIVNVLILEDVCKDNVLRLISKAAPGDNFGEYNSLRILRYIILNDIKDSAEENDTVLDAVENVYADFDYPSDMNPLIRYIPVENDKYDAFKHTQEENKQRLIEKFELFLKTEKQWIERTAVGRT